MKNYKTQMEAAKKGILTPEMETVAKKENLASSLLMERLACGSVAIPANIRHTALSAEGIGSGLKTKINVNLGISGDCKNYDIEMQKAEMAVKFGAEAIMDLSNFGKTNTFRQALIARIPAMIGTVPMYDAIGYLEKDLMEITAEDFLQVVRAHAEEGVDFMTIHAGINRRAVEAFRREGRKMNIVSRGGSLLFAWMAMTGQENPFYEYYDEVLEILREYDVTISLGDALRPGCIDDSTDAGQISELIELGSLTKRAWEKDVQVMVEGPGHMAMNEIAANMLLQKRICHNAPFYVLGPLVTDIAPGYDHITSAIGGAIAAASGADFLCYVTPAEHLRLPDLNDVKEGIVASKIAAHAADIAKGLPGARDADNRMAEARHKMDWEEMFKLAIDGEKARQYFESIPPADRHTCSMCGKMCAVRTTNRILEEKKVEFCSEKQKGRVNMNSITQKVCDQITVLRSKAPLVHNITNYVTVNDVANALLAIGASPIMADDMEEAADITALSSALVINIGTLNKRTIASMIASGKKANTLGIPVVFDPVGAGASLLRNETTRKILNQVQISILRGNLSEVSFVAGLEVSTKGVDSSEADEKNDGIWVAKTVAKRLHCVAAITGAVDILSDGEKIIKVSNGHKMLSKVTGTGCMTSALVGAFAGAGTDMLAAASGGIGAMGIAGEIAFEKAGNIGAGSFHMAIIDALSQLDGTLMAERARLYEE